MSKHFLKSLKFSLKSRVSLKTLENREIPWNTLENRENFRDFTSENREIQLVHTRYRLVFTIRMWTPRELLPYLVKRYCSIMGIMTEWRTTTGNRQRISPFPINKINEPRIPFC